MSITLTHSLAEVPGIEFVKLLEPAEGFRYYRLLVRMVDGREVRIAFGAHWVEGEQSEGACLWMGEATVKMLKKALDCGDTDVPPHYGMTGMDSELYLRGNCGE